jgi:hypothetical protein
MSPAFAAHRHALALALPSESGSVLGAFGLTGLLLIVLVLIGLLGRSPGALTIG